MSNKIDFSDRINSPSPESAFAEMFGIGVGTSAIRKIGIDLLIPFEGQPFKPYTQDKLEELSKDIAANGILSPLLIRPKGNISWTQPS